MYDLQQYQPPKEPTAANSQEALALSPEDTDENTDLAKPLRAVPCLQEGVQTAQVLDE